MWLYCGDGVSPKPDRATEATNCLTCGAFGRQDLWPRHRDDHEDARKVFETLNKLIDDYNGLVEAMRHDLSNPRHRNPE